MGLWMSVSSRLSQRIGDSGIDLQGISIESRHGIVQVAVDKLDRKCQLIEQGNDEASRQIGGIGVHVVPFWHDIETFIPDHSGSEFVEVCFSDGVSHEILVRTCDQEFLFRVIDGKGDIELLIGILEYRVSQSTSVNLLQIQPLGGIVVNNGVRQKIKILGKVFILFCIPMVDICFDGRGIRLGDASIGAIEVQYGSITGV